MSKTKKKTNITPDIKKYTKFGIIATVVVVVAALGMWGISAIRTNMSVERSLAAVSGEAVTAADLRLAVIRMDAIQMESKALIDLRKQKESFEDRLRADLIKEQKVLEKEKSEIEKSQDVLSQDALQRRISEYQNRVANLQRSLTERAQGIENAFQKALTEVQSKHLDPLVDGIIEKKQLSLVVDGRFARIGKDVPNLDITNDVITALDKRISKFKMDTPKTF